MAPLKAKILISFILLIVLLMLPDEATSQRRRRGMIASNTAQTDSLQGNDSLRADTVTVRIDSIAPVKKKQPLDAPVVYESNDSTVFTLEELLHFMVAEKLIIRTSNSLRKLFR